MTNANYDRFFKILGKLCTTYDNAGTSLTTQNLQRYRFVEQIAKSDQEVTDLAAIDLLTQYLPTWKAAVASGVTTLQSLMVQMAGALFTSSDFTAAIITVAGKAALTSTSSAPNVIAALAVEMAAAQDNKKLSTLAATGLVNFMNQVAGSAQAWNTIIDASADYKDSVYVIITIA